MKPVHDLIITVANKIMLPDVYRHIRDLVLTPDAKIDDFVAVINRDPALTTRVIRMANSQFFGYSRKVSSLKQAISLIGVMQLHDLLLSSLAIRAFSTIPSDIINQEAFWRNSIYCGITARLLAKKCKLAASERLFTSGLLHDIGHLVMYTKMPEQIGEVLYLFEQSNKPMYILERDHLGFDYAQVGSEIMRLWLVPESYTAITSLHTEPEKAENNSMEIKIVSLSRTIMLNENLVNNQTDFSFLNRPSRLLHDNISTQDVEEIAHQAKSYIEDVMDCLWPLSNRASQDIALI